MVDPEVVGNLVLGTDLEVDNIEACTESGVDKHPEEYGVDLGVCTVLKVENLEVALQAETNYLGVAPQVIIDYLEVEGLEYYQTS